MKIRNDGSIQPSGLPSFQNLPNRNNNTLYRCMVSKVKYVDDKDNITQNAKNPEVLYDVVIMGGPESGQIISNCRLSSLLAGNLNYYERVLKASTKKFNKDPLVDHDGDIVFVMFTQGHSGYPVIIAGDGGTDTNKVTGAKKSDGHLLRHQYNGIYEGIDKEGVYTFIRRGGELKDDEFIPNDAEQYKKVIGKNETMTDTWFSGLKREIDGKNDKLAWTFKGGMNLEFDGKGDKAIISTAGGAIIEVDGKGGKITLTKGSTIIEIDGNGDKISLKGGFVDLGSSVSDFAVLFTELLTAFNTHTHQFIDITPGGPVPSVTMPPLAPMLASVGSTTVKVSP